MPKMKSKSSAKKRFGFTGSGKVRRNHAKKSHNLSQRPTSMKRKARGTRLVSDADSPAVRRYLPYGRGG